MAKLSGEVYYHGRTGVIHEYFDSGYVVYFFDTGEEEWINKDELESQQ